MALAPGVPPSADMAMQYIQVTNVNDGNDLPYVMIQVYDFMNGRIADVAHIYNVQAGVNFGWTDITINGHALLAPIFQGEALFTNGAQTVDFNNIIGGVYAEGSQYNAMAGDDTVLMATNATEAAQAGFQVGHNFDAGDGNDTVTGRTLDDNISLGSGDDVVYGGTGNDTLSGDAGNDFLRGDEGNDIINGGDGKDLIWGGTGNDIINGDAGDDTIIGDTGADVLTGGAGKDTFDVHLQSDNTFDTITDFQIGVDRLMVGGLNVGLSPGELGNVVRVSYDGAGGSIVQFSQTGQAADFKTVAMLAGTLPTNFDMRDIAIQQNLDLQVNSWGQRTFNGTMASDEYHLGVNSANTTGVVTINAGEGNDHLDLSNFVSGITGYNINMGNGDDFIQAINSSGYGTGLADTAMMRLDGGAGNDVMQVQGGNMILHGGAGDDTLSLDTLNVNNAVQIVKYDSSDIGHGVDTINNFSSNDRVEISNLLDYHGNMADYVRMVQTGSSVSLQVDMDGAANGHNYVNVANITNATVGHEISMTNIVVS
jgi:Ca2+-binding RTX toxin-like protein